MFKHKKKCQHRGCAVAVLMLSMVPLFFTPVVAEEECATDFFSQKTCRSFDIMDPGIEQFRDSQQSVEEAALWNRYSGFSGSQIWYRNPLDGNWMLMSLRGREVLGNRAIHMFRCLTDLFGNVVCNTDRPTPKVPLDKKLPEQK